MYLLSVVFREVPQLSQSGNTASAHTASARKRRGLTRLSLCQNAYAATAINSTSFCTSARDAFVILVENALRVATINAIGDFVLFLGKVRRRRRRRRAPVVLVCSAALHLQRGPRYDAAVSLARAGLDLSPRCLSLDPDCDIDHVRRRRPSQLPEGLRRVAAAAHHRLSLLLPGGSLLPVHL